MLHSTVQLSRSLAKILDLHSRRQHEELSSDLEVTLDDVDRNEKSKIYRTLLVSEGRPLLSLLL